jgi:dienelactone hydrolase
MSFCTRLALAAGLLLAPAAASAEQAACRVGAYRSPGGELLALVRRDEGFRYYFVDGRFGAVAAEASPVSCAADAVVVRDRTGVQTWPRVALRETPTSFDSEGVKLAGLLIEPAEASGKPPLVVVGHGSENTGAIGRSAYAILLAAQGVSAFTFDKRGTGSSGGTYTQNFRLLAKDVAAAATEARRMVKGRYSRFGMLGGSQGGWVVPLAATIARPDFVEVVFGGIFTPLEEDSEQVFLELRDRGYGEDVIAKAREVTEAVDAVVVSHFASGYDQLARVKAAYGAEPWFSQIQGEFTGDVLKASEAELRRDGPAKIDNLGLEWTYDSMPVLRSLSAPVLWVLAGEDREAPVAITHSRLDILRKEGRDIRVVVFPHTDHGIVEFETLPDGKRKATRVSDGYWRLIADWAKGRLSKPYGKAVFE